MDISVTVESKFVSFSRTSTDDPEYKTYGLCPTKRTMSYKLDFTISDLSTNPEHIRDILAVNGITGEIATQIIQNAITAKKKQQE